MKLYYYFVLLHYFVPESTPVVLRLTGWLLGLCTW
ncbi:hypothetical protein pp309_000005 [Proteus phage 309]|uniref:Uncharacterized protein n=1 Tax=Proteus phage 309 TaxID=2894355 RepID=A0AAE8YIU9_9CAUD|nr:hypothetical protein pp309_000005 [Proteus phage 309]